MKKVITFIIGVIALTLYVIHLKLIGLMPVNADIMADAATIAGITGLGAGIVYLYKKVIKK